MVGGGLGDGDYGGFGGGVVGWSGVAAEAGYGGCAEDDAAGVGCVL